jgi:hypothetical protein
MCWRPSARNCRGPGLSLGTDTVGSKCAGRDGRTRTALVHEFTCLWYKPFHTRPIKVTLVRNPNSTKDFDIAIASTDTATTAQTIERYDGRWVIETVHQEAKNHGVGDARNRVQGAVQRAVPFGFLTMTITIAWYQLCGDPPGRPAGGRPASPPSATSPSPSARVFTLGMPRSSSPSAISRCTATKRPPKPPYGSVS